MNLNVLRKSLQKQANPHKARILQGFFKTGPGEYGEHDIFIGVPVPELRKLAKMSPDLDFEDIRFLIQSRIHEERLTALFILIIQFNHGPAARQKSIYSFYLRNLHFVNNWDLVDTSAEHILGAYLADKDKTLLTRLAHSRNFWKRRIAILSTFHYIKKGEFDETLKIADLLLHDSEDLIHKAVGWLLREIGKRDLPAEEVFLKRHYKTMPRTMLRYAIERFPEPKRRAYLKG
ncbi:DNA alkylation repair protein [bacterium]|nr:DNA alkylation repair protein [bacterium]